MINLEKLGRRICIIGCSSSGKSTLANKLSAKLNIPVFHLDRLAHYSNSTWQRKPDSEFIAAHQEILRNNSWIIDGNYSICMNERVSDASSIIWLDPSILSSAWRYVVRSLRREPNRVGGPGAKSEFRFFMLKQILFVYPKNRLKYQQIFNKYGKLVISIKSMKDLNKYCLFWHLRK